MIDFRQSVQTERRRLDWTVYRLAKESGQDKATLGRWLAGKQDISAAKVQAVLNTLRFGLQTPRKRG